MHRVHIKYFILVFIFYSLRINCCNLHFIEWSSCLIQYYIRSLCRRQLLYTSTHKFGKFMWMKMIKCEPFMNLLAFKYTCVGLLVWLRFIPFWKYFILMLLILNFRFNCFICTHLFGARSYMLFANNFSFRAYSRLSILMRVRARNSLFLWVHLILILRKRTWVDTFSMAFRMTAPMSNELFRNMHKK